MLCIPMSAAESVQMNDEILHWIRIGIANDKVELERLYVYMLGFGSFGLDGRKQGAERLPSKP